jgi:hypothetical protein
MSKSSKIYFPMKTKAATITKAVMQAFRAILFLDSWLLSAVSERKTVVMEMGFTMAKNPVNTVME